VDIRLHKLASWSISAQALLFCATPVLTRLFTPETLGLAALFTTVYGSVVPVTTLKYDQAIILPKMQHHAAAIGTVALMLATLTSMIASIIVTLCYFHNAFTFPAIWFFLPFAMWIGAAYTLMQQFAVRDKNYSGYAQAGFACSVVNVTFSLSLGTMFPDENWVIPVAFTGSLAAGMFFLRCKIGRWPLQLLAFTVTMWWVWFRRFRDFPTVVLPTVLVAVIGANGLPVALAAFYSLTDVGHYSVANRVLVVPSAVIGAIVTEVIRSKFARISRSGGGAAQFCVRASAGLLLGAVPIFALIYFVSETAFPIFFGHEYAVASEIARGLTLYALAQFLCAPFVSVFAILRKPIDGLVAQCVIALTPTVCFVIAALINMQLISAIRTASIVSLIMGVFYFLLVYRACRHFDSAKSLSKVLD
jgi:O-antigen/teichoic acid export membrane protein